MKLLVCGAGGMLGQDVARVAGGGARGERAVLVRTRRDRRSCGGGRGRSVDALLNCARLLIPEDFGVAHVSAAGQCSWYDFAVEIFRRAGVDCRVTPCRTGERGAAR